MKINLQLLGKIVGSALLGLEDATQAVSNPATEAADIQDFVGGMIKIWASTQNAGATTSPLAALEQTAVAAVPSSVTGHVEPQVISGALRR